MTSVQITNDGDVSILLASDPIVIVADFDVEVIQELDQGPPGPQGITGAKGADGNTVLYGAADPANTIGVDGNFYINTTTHFMFGPKFGGAWPAGTSLVGPQGIQGIQGIQGSLIIYGSTDPTPAVGHDGDSYINTTTHFLFGPKAGGVWPAGTSLIGPQGPQGIQGPAGTATVITSDTPPGSPADNVLWWKSDSGLLYVRYNDGDSSQWVVAVAIPDTGIPSGTVMVFYQGAAPVGWTQVTTQNDKALRVVSGAGGVFGGTNPFSTVMAQTVVGGHTMTLAETASGITSSGSTTLYPSGTSNYWFPIIAASTWYQLGILQTATAAVPPGYNIAYTNVNTAPTGTNQVSGGVSLASNNTGGGAHNHPITMAIQYCDVILASKN